MKLRVGLVGLGPAWENRHRPALRALSDRFDVKAICDQVAHRAERAAHDFDAHAVDGFRALTRRGDVDAILLLSRQWYGVLPILAACDSDKAVYCAAGLDIEPEQARRIRDRVDRAGIAFMAEFPCRQAPATLRLKELIATRLGPPRLLFCHRRNPAEDVDTARPGKRSSEKTRFSDLIELVDWCCYVVGRPPDSVFGMMHCRSPQTDDEDYQMMSLDFSGDAPLGTGATAQISNGRYVPTLWPEAVAFRPPAALQVCCENGLAFIDLPSTLIWFDRAGRHQESLEHERPVGEQLLSNFYRSVTSLLRNTASLHEVYAAMSIVHLARLSHQQGRRMTVEY